MTLPTRTIGSLEVSIVGLGCNNFGGRLDSAGTDAVVGAALDEGVTLFDTADIYGGARSEELLGKALGNRRDSIVLATKFGMAYADHEGGADPAYIRRAVEDSLKRLGTDRIDLYQQHFPDDKVAIEDTLGALAELVEAGKVREIGCSNFDVARLEAAASAAATASSATDAPRFVSVQNEYSLLKREPELGVLDTCSSLSMAFLPYFPLDHGLLSGKYRKGEPPPSGTRLGGMDPKAAAGLMSDAKLDQVEALRSLAESRGHSLLDLAFAFLLSRPQVASVIAGATKPEQIKANVAAAGWELTAEDLAAIDGIAPVAQ